MNEYIVNKYYKIENIVKKINKKTNKITTIYLNNLFIL